MGTNPGQVYFKTDGVLTTVQNFSYRIGETESTGYKDVFKNGTPTIYALRFDGGTPNRIQYTAWRYVTARGTGQPYIDCVYLGPNFKGTLDDITQDSFWNFHSGDRVRRLYAKGAAFYSPTRPGVSPDWVEAELLVTHLIPNPPNAFVFVSDNDSRELHRYLAKAPRGGAEYRAPMIMKQTHDNFDNTNL